MTKRGGDFRSGWLCESAAAATTWFCLCESAAEATTWFCLCESAAAATTWAKEMSRCSKMSIADKISRTADNNMKTADKIPRIADNNMKIADKIESRA